MQHQRQAALDSQYKSSVDIVDGWRLVVDTWMRNAQDSLQRFGTWTALPYFIPHPPPLSSFTRPDADPRGNPVMPSLCTGSTNSGSATSISALAPGGKPQQQGQELVSTPVDVDKVCCVCASQPPRELRAC